MASWPTKTICVEAVDNMQAAPDAEDHFLSILSTHLSLLGDALGQPECGGSSDLALALLSSRTAIARALGDSHRRSAGPQPTSLPTPHLPSGDSRPSTANGWATNGIPDTSSGELRQPKANTKLPQAPVKLPWAETPSDAPAVLDVESTANSGRTITLIGSKAFSCTPTVTFRSPRSQDSDSPLRTSGNIGAGLNTPDDADNLLSLRDTAAALKVSTCFRSPRSVTDGEVGETCSEVNIVSETKEEGKPNIYGELPNGVDSSTCPTTVDDRVRQLQSENFIGFFSEESDEGGWYHELVRGRAFEIFFACLIIANAGYIAYDTDWQVKNPSEKPPLGHQILDVMFLCVFSVEVVMRAVADGSSYLSKINDDRSWNIFDVIVISVSWVDEILYIMETSDMISMSALRVLRVLRLMRVVRVVRVVRFFRDLRVMVFGIMNSMRTLSWAVLLLMLIIFVFAVTLVQAVAEELSQQAKAGEDYSSELLRLYGSLFKAIYTLYCSVCGGLDWDDAAGPLMDFNVFLGFLFCVYVALAVLCVLNIVTGLFVENASKMITRDEDHMLLEELEHRKHWLEECKRLFHHADQNHDGKIDLEEFTDMVRNVKLQAKLRHLGIELNEANCHNVFRLLDSDGDGIVDLEEFVSSFQQLEGGARAIDLVYLMRDVRAVRRQMDVLTEELGIPLGLKSKNCSPYTWEMETMQSEPSSLPSSMPRHSIFPGKRRQQSPSKTAKARGHSNNEAQGRQLR
eukprot:CAMPEP_0169342698 /NCGR_PEP_ID=MMETSP1017-20121227/20139_1 /TAXON_ID=342587 /ORGANISM="Karlodinium micrum, Strain CCMP2283" /LENGTH=741 /DNA_ID=CAMNT_0009438419 /DNA_START=46 /DNA_END=2271 /DNA_ORIENTATION=+